MKYTIIQVLNRWDNKNLINYAENWSLYPFYTNETRPHHYTGKQMIPLYGCHKGWKIDKVDVTLTSINYGVNPDLIYWIFFDSHYMTCTCKLRIGTVFSIQFNFILSLFNRTYKDIFKDIEKHKITTKQKNRYNNRLRKIFPCPDL